MRLDLFCRIFNVVSITKCDHVALQSRCLAFRGLWLARRMLCDSPCPPCPPFPPSDLIEYFTVLFNTRDCNPSILLFVVTLVVVVVVTVVVASGRLPLLLPLPWPSLAATGPVTSK